MRGTDVRMHEGLRRGQKALRGSCGRGQLALRGYTTKVINHEGKWRCKDLQ
jgi:hypothetical protein